MIFGSVAPIILAGLEPEDGAPPAWPVVITSGLAYGVAFAAGYGLLGALVGRVA